MLLMMLLTLSAAEASTLKISPNSALRAASEVEANYSTSHIYIDEVAGDVVPITVFFDPQVDPSTVESAEILTNLNRRDRADDDADADGIQDGIKPPNANTIAAGSDTHYFKAYAMSGAPGGYQLTLGASNAGVSKTGAYRLTARYRLNGDTPGTYRYYNSEVANGLNKRDHAIVLSPKSTRDIQLYEVNPLTITATGTQPGQRGTFATLANGVGGGPRFSLQYVKDLGANMLWFQPVHPNGIAGRQLDPANGNQPFEVGSPYAVKNFFEIHPLLSSQFSPPANATPAQNDPSPVPDTDANYATSPRGRARTEFASFVAAADTAGVGVMLDAPFNHTSYDTELATFGQSVFGNGGTTAMSEMRNVEARFFARTGEYDRRASNAGNIAIAPDRIAEFAFADTFDIYLGRYASLTSNTTGGHLSEADWFDYSIGDENSDGDGNGHFDAVTQKVWRLFAEYLQHWLTQTGYPANPSGAPLNSIVGIDALRADFGQGLPPQMWEYLINRTRTRRWNFIFMAESLDGGAVTYRSGRHFDILNENIVFPLHAAQNTTQFRQIYEDRRNAYGQALVLLNTSSHDEDHYQDPFHALIRHAANSAIDGVPLIFPGQELGLSGTVIPPSDTNLSFTPFGYDRYETNSSKPIPHFKKYNSLMPLWLKTQLGHPTYNYGLAQLAAVFSGIGQARKFSPALRGSNRFFLNLRNNTPHGQIFSVAKFDVRNAAPNLSDVVFAFVNLDRNANPATPNDNRYNVNIDTDGDTVNDFGIKPARRYNVKNIAAYLGVDSTRRDLFLIPGDILGSDLLGSGITSGLFVALNRVPTTDGAWGTAPYEAQYLKLYDVTPPPAAGAPGTPKAYAIGNQAVFSWTPASDPEGGISGYELTITGAGAPQVITLGNVTSHTFIGAIGQTLQATVRAINGAGIKGATSMTSSATVLLSATGDQDGDGMANGSEETAGTNPLNGSSVFRVTEITWVSPSSAQLTWSSVPGIQYEVRATTDLSVPFANISGATPIPATGNSTTYLDNSAAESRRFYSVRVVP